MLGWPPKDNAVLQLSRLTNLKTLRIPQTNLKDLDNLTRLNNLQTLDLTGNNPIDDFRSVGLLTNLHTLDISNTRPSLVTFRCLESVSSLRHLYLRDCSGIKLTILKQLSNLVRLETLFVKLDKDKNIGKKAFQYLGKLVNLSTLGVMGRAIPISGIEHLTKLKTLYLRGDGWSLESLTHINHLAKLTNLSKLSVNCGLLSMEHFHYIATLTNLEDLTLDKPHGTPYGTPQKYKGIENLGKKLKRLYVERLFADASVIAALSHLHTLSIINGYNNNALKEVSLRLVKLEILSLEGTENVVDKEVKHLSKLTSLRELSLAKTAITDEGVMALTTLKYLESFNLSHCNKLTNKVVPSLVTLKRLRSIHLQGCTAISELGLLPLDKMPCIHQVVKPNQNRFLGYHKWEDW